MILTDETTFTASRKLRHSKYDWSPLLDGQTIFIESASKGIQSMASNFAKTHGIKVRTAKGKVNGIDGYKVSVVTATDAPAAS
jgi:hypothetical protein